MKYFCKYAVQIAICFFVIVAIVVGTLLAVFVFKDTNKKLWLDLFVYYYFIISLVSCTLLSYTKEYQDQPNGLAKFSFLWQSWVKIMVFPFLLFFIQQTILH